MLSEKGQPELGIPFDLRAFDLWRSMKAPQAANDLSWLRRERELGGDDRFREILLDDLGSDDEVRRVLGLLEAVKEPGE